MAYVEEVCVCLITGRELISVDVCDCMITGRGLISVDVCGSC